MSQLRSIKVFVLISILVSNCAKSTKKPNERHVKRLLNQLSRRHAEILHDRNIADWNYGINITEHNQQLKAVEKCQEFEKYAWALLKNFNSTDYKDEAVRRQIDKYSVLGISALGHRAIEFSKLITKMQTIYGESKVCVNGKCDLSLDPDLTHLMATSRDYDTLLESWVNWRDAAGKKIRPMYDQYVKLGNEMAVKNRDKEHQFSNYGDYMLNAFEVKTIKDDLEKVWKEVEPFYKELHAFTRMKLRNIYRNKMPTDGTIPAHLLGNMWAQYWNTLLRDVSPFPNAQMPDVTSSMINKNYTRVQLFKLAEKFFVGIGLNKMPNTFWKRSMLEKPSDRKVVCHPVSFDFADGKDYRIRQCTEVTMEHLITAHHEMGHSEYFMAFRHQPVILREGANPGFHEAIGDTIALSVATPQYLKSIGLLSETESSEEALINHQLKMALEKIAFLPFAYLVDLWRWDVFSGNITTANYNKKWWEYRVKYQGVSAPVERSENDFDPGAKFHVPADIAYISYFVALFLQFQFHESLCKVANQPVLYQCSIAGNKQAGANLRRMLSYGSSVPWPRQLKEMTGSEKLTAKPILEYFQPLRTFFKKALKNEKIGWKNERSKSTSEEEYDGHRRSVSKNRPQHSREEEEDHYDEDSDS